MTVPFQVVWDFESAVADYCGSPFAVSTTSCTMAIQMALAWHRHKGYFGPNICMPKLSYVGVCASIKNAGFDVVFREDLWEGEYLLDPVPVYDSARRFTSGMFKRGYMHCISGHWSKILSVSQLGLVLHDDAEADIWMRKYRFDGRTEGVNPKQDQVQYPSVHAYLSPEVAAHGLVKLSLLPRYNADLPRSDYPDLSLLKAFQ